MNLAADLDPASFRSSKAEGDTHRVIPSRFPPIDAFETARSPTEARAVADLEGWTNDRLVASRMSILPDAEWVHGRPCASVVMAAYTHASPNGSRFCDATLGAWYSASSVETALVEAINGIRHELTLNGLTEMREQLREYLARPLGPHLDVRGDARGLHDPNSYRISQPFGELVRSQIDPGDPTRAVGIHYDSVRDRDASGLARGTCRVSYRPPLVSDVRQARHFEVDVPATGRPVVREMPTSQGVSPSSPTRKLRPQ